MPFSSMPGFSMDAGAGTQLMTYVDPSFGTASVAGGAALPGIVLSLPADGSALPTVAALDAAANGGTLHTTTDAILAPAVSGDVNALLLESGNTVSVPAGYDVVVNLSTSFAPTISTSGSLATTVLGGLFSITVGNNSANSLVLDGQVGITVWDNSANETVYTGGGQSNVIGMSAMVMESLDVVLSGVNDVVAVGVGDATVTGGGYLNTIWGSGSNALSNLVVDLTQGSSTVMAGAGSNTIDLGGSNDVIFAGSGTNNDTISGDGDIYVAGSGMSSVTAGAWDVIYAGSAAMNATIGGAEAMFVGNSGNDTINASTGATGWGGSGTMNFISSGNTTIIGGSGATTSIQNSGTGDYFNNGAGVMTVSGGSGPATITETWAGKGGMLVNAGANGGDTINMTEGSTTVVAGSAHNSVNFYGNASGNVWLAQGNTVDLASSGYVAVNDTTAALSGNNLINAQGDTGTANITFGAGGDTVIGGAGTNIYTPVIPTNDSGASMSVSFGIGSNELVLNPQNTSVTSNLSIYNFNPNRDVIDFNGFGSTIPAQRAAIFAALNLATPNGQPMGSTFFSTGNTIVALFAGTGPASQTPLPDINVSHFIST